MNPPSLRSYGGQAEFTGVSGLRGRCIGNWIRAKAAKRAVVHDVGQKTQGT